MRIVVTQGEERGIGPEIVLKALPGFSAPAGVEVEILGDPALLHAAAEKLNLPRLTRIRPVKGPVPALAALEAAADLARKGYAAAIVTAPVNKARLRDAGFAFPGQTEFFARRLGAEDHAMMLAREGLRVVPVTTHIPLREVAGALDRERLARCVRTVDRSLRRDFGVRDPRIAVLGVNPHAGEDGHFGTEEAEVVLPVLDALLADGLRVEGPLPADAAFAPRARDRFDALVGMYHDQVLAPFKALAGGRGVNVTLGLPVIRTSPDHGTAEDIAGLGVACPASFRAALDLAVRLALRREFLGGRPPPP